MPGIAGALLYLRITSLQNALLSRLRRLKQPRYLAGAVMGAAYLYFVVFRRAFARQGASFAGAGAFREELLPVAAAVGSLLLFLVALGCWVWPRDRASLRFSEAEIGFLFPAPVRRRTLIHYQLLSSQGRILFTALIASLVSARWSFLPGNPAMRIVGWWIIVATLSLHIMGSSFAVTTLLDRGVTTLRRQIITIGGFIVIAGVLLAWIWRDVYAPRADDVAGVAAFARYLSAMLGSGPLPWLLLPTRLVIQPLLATDLRSFLLALGPALLLYLAHYLWVVNTEVSFEEASIARAEKRAVRTAARREGKIRLGHSTPKARPAPFNLDATSRPELAFLWKNLLSTASYLRPRTAVVTAVIIVAVCSWFSGNSIYEAIRPGIATFGFLAGAYVIVLGPQLARQDLRNDLANADLLKSYPLHGWQVVVGELLTPVAIITVLAWLMLLTAVITIPPGFIRWLPTQWYVGLAVGLALIAPLLSALQLLVLNTAAVLFPAWLQSARQAGGGIDVMGQRLLFVAGNLVVVIVSLVPAAVAAFALFFAGRWVAGDVAAAVVAVVAVLAVLSVEAWLGILWLGRRFDRFDLSAELAA